jgi:hypothetical protein
MRDVVPPLDPVKPAKKQIASEAPAGFAETSKFDYAAAAELFTRNGPKPHSGEAGAVPPAADWTRARSARRNALTYRRFATGAEAIRFAVEEPGRDRARKRRRPVRVRRDPDLVRERGVSVAARHAGGRNMMCRRAATQGSARR